MKLKPYLLLTLTILVNQILIAQNFEIDGIAYNITSDVESYTVEVTSKNPNYEGEIIIPEQVDFEENTYSVTSIGNNAFDNADNMTSIIMPNSILVISDYSFFSCDNLSSVAFSSSIFRIGQQSFGSCSSISEFVLPNSLDSICNGAFTNCLGVTSFLLPNSVRFIGNDAFMNCTNLTTITIPPLVDSIGRGLFKRCSNLDSIMVHDSNPFFISVEGVLFNSDTTSLLEFPAGRDGEYLMPNKVRIIESEAFSLRSYIEYVRLSDSLNCIKSGAFCSCQSLDSIYIPRNVDTIGFEAFRETNSLKKIVVDDLNTNYSSLEGVLFNKDQSILIQYPGSKFGSYIIPNTVNRINDKAFYLHEHITSIEIPGCVSNIGEWCFYHCNMLNEVQLGFGIDCISEFAFENNDLLDSIIIPNSVKHLGKRAFGYCDNLRSCILSDSITCINQSAFSGCTSLDSIIIPNLVDSLYYSAFSGCENLKNVKMGDNISYIGGSAFYGCLSLNSFTCCAIAVPEFGCYAFYNVPLSTSLYVPSQSIDDYQSAIQLTNFNIIGIDNCSILSHINKENQIISLYPNPFREVINIENSSGSSGELKLFNIYGKEILSIEIGQSSEIIAKDISSGIYLYKIRFEDGRISAGKIIKE